MNQEIIPIRAADFSSLVRRVSPHAQQGLIATLNSLERGFLVSVGG